MIWTLDPRTQKMERSAGGDLLTANVNQTEWDNPFSIRFGSLCASHAISVIGQYLLRISTYIRCTVYHYRIIFLWSGHHQKISQILLRTQTIDTELLRVDVVCGAYRFMNIDDDWISTPKIDKLFLSPLSCF
jgi:hypothetical protein